MHLNAQHRCPVRTTTLAYGIAVGLLAAYAPAHAQTPATQKAEEVVITGTSIRGVEPVGSNLLTVGRDAIESSAAQSLQQILSSVPALTGFGNASQGAFGSADGGGTYAPTVHGLGASASNGTLVLIDGHRIPLTGIAHTLVDPNVIAPLAIQRVEVLADGASAVYGSDAVAGVLNFITRRNFTGAEVSAQAGYAKNYHTNAINTIYGDAWETGSMLLSYGYSKRSALRLGDRSFTAADHRAQGGANFSNANCSPASVTTTAGTFAYPYSGAAIANALAGSSPTSGGFCDYTGVADQLPEDTRHNILVKLEKFVGDNLTLNSDMVYSKKTGTAKIARGAVTANTWGTGNTAVGAAQINPFFVAPAGATAGTVRFQADDLLGAGAKNKTGQSTFFVTAGVEYKLANDWVGTFGATVGQDDSFLRRVGALCTSCAQLALNGTTNQNGSLTTPSIPGTTVVVTQALTAANALDAWSPIGSNRTSAAVLKSLTDSDQISKAKQTLTDFTLKFDGPLFSLPGGEVRAAVGAELIKYILEQNQTTAGNAGPASAVSSIINLDYDRTVKSAYVEVLVPIIGKANALPGVSRLDFSVAGRYDDYSDFGNTSNPKLAATWEVTKGIEFKGSYSKSFTAPALTSRGNANGITSESGFNTFGFGSTVVPLGFTDRNGVTAVSALGAVPGACTATACTIGSAAITGIQLTGGNKDLKPQKGKNYSLGLGFAPQFAPGLRLSATWWNAEVTGAVTAPLPQLAANGGLNQLFIFAPTAAQIAAVTTGAGLPQAGALPGTTYFIYSFQQQNALNLKVSGIDLDVNYRFNSPAGKVDLGLNVSDKLKFDQSVGTAGATFSVLNTAGFNGTFPSNKLSARFTAGLQREDLSGQVAINYTGSYRNWNGSAPYALTLTAAGTPASGGQSIPSFTTVDLHLSYNFGKQGQGWLTNTEITFDGNNVFDKKPPFFNTAVGYDVFNANPIGRLLTVGVRKKW